jgi:hypothetical protein
MYPHIYRNDDSFLRTNETVKILGPTGFSIRTSKFYQTSVYNQYIYYTDRDKKHKHTILFELDDKLFAELLHFQHRPCEVKKMGAPREYILEDFYEITKKITNSYTSPILRSLNIPQMFTQSELLWLKVDDIDGNISHLAIEHRDIIDTMKDNNILLERHIVNLNERIDGLEDMLLEVIDHNKCLQHRVDALEHRKEQKGIDLFELD